MRWLKHFAIVICTALVHGESDDGFPTELHFFDENFEPRLAKGESDDITSSSDKQLAGSSMPKKCIDAKGKAAKTRECVEWMKANPDFRPTSEPTTLAPTPSFHITSSLKEGEDDPAVEVKLKPTDDTFIEVWRPDEPLGSKEKLKIDAIDGTPTKVIMIKFQLGSILQEYTDATVNKGMTASLTGAKLRLFAITDTVFGGWVQEIDSDWNEETAVWDDYVRKGKRGTDSAAEDLLPQPGDTIGEFGNVTAGHWYEADLTGRLSEIFDGNNVEAVNQLSLRLSTDSADGVIYASKEYSGLEPELVLDFTFLLGASENNEDGTDLVQNNVQDSASSPTAETEVVKGSPTVPPSTSPADLTHFPTHSPVITETAPTVAAPLSAEETSSTADFAGEGTSKPIRSPTPRPTQIPITKKPTKAPTGSKESPSFNDASISVVSSSFKMTITAIEELFRKRRLRSDAVRGLSVFMSVDEKERPAIKKHLLSAFEILDNPPEDILLSFEDEVVVETIPKSHNDNGGVIRTSTFRVIGEFNKSNTNGATTAELAALLDQTVMYAFIGFQKETFIEVLTQTGRPIYSITATHQVSVSKVKYSTGKTDNIDGPSFAVDNPNEVSSSSNSSVKKERWTQPTLIVGAAMLFISTLSVSLIVFRMKHRGEPSELDTKPTREESPRSLESTAAPSPSPALFADRWKKKKFDYTEFVDDPDAEDSACAMTPKMSPKTTKYLNQPARDIKFSQFMSTSFEDSSVSDVSGHMLGATGAMKNGDDRSISEDENFLLDTTQDSYNMEALSALDHCRLENVLQLDRASPQPNLQSFPVSRADDISLNTTVGSLPSELYSNINTSADSDEMQSYDTGAAYASHLITLDMITSIDSMPPPPSDVASDSSSVQDVNNLEMDHNMIENEAEDRLLVHAKALSALTDTQESLETKTDMIQAELSRVMQLLQTPSRELEAGGYTSPDSSADLYFHSESDTESASLASNVSVLGGVTREDPTQEKVVHPAQDLRETDEGMSDDSDSENDENDPLNAMNSALKDCIDILDKASRP